MDKRFPGDRNLADLLKWYGLALYDVTTTLPRAVSFSWEELAANEASDYLISHRYYLLPLPMEGVTVRQAYTAFRNNGTFPILRIPKTRPKEERHFTIEAADGFVQNDFNSYYINEFYFQKDSLSASSSIFFSYDCPSRVIVPAKQTVEIFNHYFTLITFAKDGSVTYSEPLRKYVD
ncbi:MAG: hypothetical protein Q7S55_00420 [Nanoarchaeota archaeon]|nr:hypothetical protein [Nanoarchaeota archaeon]